MLPGGHRPNYGRGGEHVTIGSARTARDAVLVATAASQGRSGAEGCSYMVAAPLPPGSHLAAAKIAGFAWLSLVKSCIKVRVCGYPTKTPSLSGVEI
jgi:hypothetical protein